MKWQMFCAFMQQEPPLYMVFIKELVPPPIIAHLNLLDLFREQHIVRPRGEHHSSMQAAF